MKIMIAPIVFLLIAAQPAIAQDDDLKRACQSALPWLRVHQNDGMRYGRGRVCQMVAQRVPPL
jgi:hypothetical protein